MSNPAISVIIPVYNAQKYLGATLDSILSQSFTDFELILVNDGSTDSSLDVIKEYAAKDQRIVILDKENQGTQYARQSGQQIARGKWIKTMDNDDIMLPDALLKLYKRGEECDVDMVFAPFYFCVDDYEPCSLATLDYDIVSGVDHFKLICERRANWPVWTSLHRRRLYEEHEIIVDPQIMTAEDTVLMTQLLLYSKRVASINHHIVNHILRRDSLSNSKRLSPERYHDSRVFVDWIADFVKSQSLEDELAKYIDWLYMRRAFDTMSKHHLDDFYSDMRAAISIIKKYPDSIKLLSRRERKIMTSTRIFSPMGKLNAWRYIKQGKV